MNQPNNNQAPLVNPEASDKVALASLAADTAAAQTPEGVARMIECCDCE